MGKDFFKRFVRIPRSRGFGVQSPWAYRFVRSVVSERLPFYGYVDLAGELDAMSAADRRRAKFLLRLANFLQTGKWMLVGRDMPRFSKFIKAGKQAAEITLADNLTALETTSIPDVLMVDLPVEETSFLSYFIGKYSTEQTIILNHIHDSREATRQWRQLCRHEHVSMAFDLYDCGILFFHPTQTPQNYVLRLP
mgnify:CR=1 FL=1